MPQGTKKTPAMWRPPTRSAVQASQTNPSLATMLQRQAGNQAVRALLGSTVPASLGSAVPASLVVNGTGSGGRDQVAVSRMLDSQVVVQRAPGLLTPTQERAAITFNRAQYDVNSVRVIQVITRTTVDSSFGPISAQAVATFQQTGGKVPSGLVDQPTLDAVLARSVTTRRQDYGIYAAADFFAIPTKTNALSISFKTAQAAAGSTTFEAGKGRDRRQPIEVARSTVDRDHSGLHRRCRGRGLQMLKSLRRGQPPAGTPGRRQQSDD